jgi:L-lactate dehydrogenase complex protein LldG
MNGSDAEREVLARIRGASKRQTAAQIAAELDVLKIPRAAGLRGATPCESLCAGLERNGCTTARVANRAAAVAEISRFISARHGQRRIVTGHDPRLAALPWRDGGLLPRFDAARPGDLVAVSYARTGIAETGSILQFLDRNNPALNNLLVDDHVILLDQKDIRPRLEDIWESAALGDPDQRPRGLMMISGPSSTADIAMKLVLGAHGPRSVHVIIIGVDEQPPMA